MRHLAGPAEIRKYNGPRAAGPAAWWCWFVVIAAIVIFAVDGVVTVVSISNGASPPGSRLSTVELTLMVATLLLAALAAVLLFAQLRREQVVGYSTVDWQSVRGDVLIVGAISGRVRHEVSHFDVAAARQKVPWMASLDPGEASQRALPVSAQAPPVKQLRPWMLLALAAPILMVLARLATIGRVGLAASFEAVVIAIAAVVLIVLALLVPIGIRRSSTIRLAAHVEGTRPGSLALACARDIGTSTDAARLGIRIPQFLAVVFTQDGVEFWDRPSKPTLIVTLPKDRVLGVRPGQVPLAAGARNVVSIVVLATGEAPPLSLNLSPIGVGPLLGRARVDDVRHVCDRAASLWTVGA